MSIYVSTFISGLQEPIEEFLHQEIPDIKILDVYDGLVVYSADVDIEKITKLKFLNNSFLLLKKYTNLRSDSLEAMIRDAAKMKDLGNKVAACRITTETKHFRIITSKENQLTPVNKDILRQMEQTISKLPGFKVNRAKPDHEFWFLYRSEKVGFFMLRFTKHASYDKVLQKGELRPDLSHVLCRLSDPRENDIFLDPFCGYGAIPFERIRMLPYNMTFMSDISEEHVKFCKDKGSQLSKKSKKQIIIRQANALSMAHYEDGFIDKIVTDPPWGLYGEMDISISDFYTLMFKELNRVLKQGGFIIILTSQRDTMEDVLSTFSKNVSLLEKYDILVSGKKASIYKIIKNGRA